MANTTVYPFGTEGHLPGSVGIINDCITGGADKALSAEQGVVLKGEIDTLEERIDEFDGDGGLSVEAGGLIVGLLRKAVFVDDDVQDDINALAQLIALDVVSISAVFTQGTDEFYAGESLDDLRGDLVVTGTLRDGNTATITNYRLMGTLAVGESTVKVIYRGKIDTFTVQVSEAVHFRGEGAFANKVRILYKWDSQSKNPAVIDGVTYYYTQTAFGTTLTANYRCSYYLFDLDLVAGKTYEFRLKIDGFPSDKTPGIGLQFHDATFKAAGIANQDATSSNMTSHISDSGWLAPTLDGDYYTIQYTAPSGKVGVRITLKVGTTSSDTYSWPTTATVKKLIIKEVTNE